MKKMKRLVAVLLAGVMALTMLTACGGPSFTQNSTVENTVMDFFVNGEINKNGNFTNLKVQEIPATSDVVSYFNSLASKSIVEVAKNPAYYETDEAIEEWTLACFKDMKLLGYYSLRLAVFAEDETDEASVNEFFEVALAFLIDSLGWNSAELEAHIQVYQIDKGEDAYWVMYALGREVPTAEP